MHFSNLAIVALIGSACAQTVEFFSDSKCQKKIQTLKFTTANVFQCGEVTAANGALSAIISKTGYTNRGFNVWDSDYCAGDMAGGLPNQQGQCLAASGFGLTSWKSAHIAPRNTSGQIVAQNPVVIPIDSNLPPLPSNVPTTFPTSILPLPTLPGGGL